MPEERHPHHQPLPDDEHVALAASHDQLWWALEAVANECGCGMNDFAAETLADWAWMWDRWVEGRPRWAYQPPGVVRSVRHDVPGTEQSEGLPESNSGGG